MTDETPRENLSLADEYPLEDDVRRERDPGEFTGGSNKIELVWERIAQAGLVEPFLRIGTHVLLVVLVVVVVWVMRQLYSSAQAGNLPRRAVMAAVLPSPTPTVAPPELPPFRAGGGAFTVGVERIPQLYTTIPTRPRVDVITYTVESGDNVFAIAERFSLKPETILWGNYDVLADNPHRLQPGQVLTILPVDGTYHRWSAGENFRKVAEYYQVDPMDIVGWSGNPFDIYDFDFDNPGIEPGTMLIIPGGRRELVDYGPPRIPRSNPAVASTYGPGHCGTLYDGLIGAGSFIWPTTEHYLSGYDYSPGANHAAIDIAGDTGFPVWAVDNGVVVYAGWSYSGYGSLVVIDHGNGWQSLYAHLNDVYVGCGQSIYQGTQVGTLGNTGNSTGSHLHFELMYETSKVNPWNFLP